MEVSQRYELVPNWEQLPAGFVHRDVADVAVDADDRVYLVTRHDPRIIVYERDGRFVRSWGEERFSARPHSITIGPDSRAYVVDEEDHTVRKFTLDGEELLVLGTSGVPSDTGADHDAPDLYERIATITHSGPPFNHPTKVTVAPGGDLYVSDGYGNARIHQFSRDGVLIRSWGSPGSGPGEFHLPHSVCISADGRLIVADRENDRLQVFSLDGEYLAEWNDAQAPTGLHASADGFIYVAETQWRRGERRWMHGVVEADRPARISVLDLSGRVMYRAGGVPPCAPGNLFRPHGVCSDSHGDVYVTEANLSGAGAVDCHTLQKFTRC